MSVTFQDPTPGGHQEGLGLTAEGIDLMNIGCRRDITDMRVQRVRNPMAVAQA
jgi:hypothetical protein